MSSTPGCPSGSQGMGWDGTGRDRMGWDRVAWDLNGTSPLCNPWHPPAPSAAVWCAGYHTGLGPASVSVGRDSLPCARFALFCTHPARSQVNVQAFPGGSLVGTFVGEEDVSSLGRVAPLPSGSSSLQRAAEGWRGVFGCASCCCAG